MIIEEDLEQLAISCNEDEKLKNELSFWDYLWFIKAKKDQGLTLKEIAKKLGLGNTKTEHYSKSLGKISSKLLELCANTETSNGGIETSNVRFQEG